MLGTPAGRGGDAHLAWSPDMRTWTYWTGAGVSEHLRDAAVVLPAPVAELSVIYHQPSKQWVLVSYDETRAGIAVRTAPILTGPWTHRGAVLAQHDLPGLYGGFLHPDSAHGDLLFTVSTWGPYQVVLYRIPAAQLS